MKKCKCWLVSVRLCGCHKTTNSSVLAPHLHSNSQAKDGDRLLDHSALESVAHQPDRLPPVDAKKLHALRRPAGTKLEIHNNIIPRSPNIFFFSLTSLPSGPEAAPLSWSGKPCSCPLRDSWIDPGPYCLNCPTLCRGGENRSSLRSCRRSRLLLRLCTIYPLVEK